MPKSVLQIWFDPVCPWCFIGHARLERAKANVGENAVKFDWRPYQLAPDVPDEGVARADYFAAKFGGAERANAAWARVAAAGVTEQVAFDFDNIPIEPNTLNAHRAVRFAKAGGHEDALIQALFVAHFQRSLDIGSPDVLGRLANEVGMDGAVLTAHLNSAADKAETRQEAERSRQLGVRGVPTYALNDRILTLEQSADLSALLRTT